MFTPSTLSGGKAEQYQQLIAQCQALLQGERHRIANAANLSALLFNSLPDLNWLGFYFLEQGELVVGPFQGLPAYAAPLRSPAKANWLPTCMPSKATSPAIRLRNRNWWCR